MSIALCTHRGRAAVEIADAKGWLCKYLYAVTVTTSAWSVRLTALDPKTGEPARDRQGRERTYAATFSGLGEFCQCPDYMCRRLHAGQRCKHLEAATELKTVLEAMAETTP